MREQKSLNERKGPPLCRSFSKAATKLRPTFFTAARPKRMVLSQTVKSAPDWLMSGVRMVMPISRHSRMYSDTLALSPSTEVRRAAIYSVG